MNKCFLLGNLGADPDFKYVGESAVLEFRLATSRKYKDRNGEKQEDVQWHSCVMWGQRAEALSKYLEKGTKVLVEGAIETRSWEDKQTGAKRYKTEIKVFNLEFAGGGGGQRQEPRPPARQERRRRPASSQDDWDDPPAERQPRRQQRQRRPEPQNTEAFGLDDPNDLDIPF